MTLPSDPDQNGFEYAGEPAEADVEGAVLSEGIPDEDEDEDAAAAADGDGSADDTAGRGEAQPDWRDFSSEILQPDQSQPFGDKAPDDLRG